MRLPLSTLLACTLLFPSLSRAEEEPQQEDKSVVDRVRDWVSNLGKPKPPEPPKYKPGNTITLNPFALQQQRLGLEYERALGKPMSLYLAPQVAYGRTGDLWRLSSSATLGARFFVMGEAPSGIFFGPEVGLAYERARTEEGLRKGYGLGFGASVGWTLVLFDRFTLSAGFSAQYRSVPDLTVTGPESLTVEFVALPRLAFGIAF